MNIPADVAKLAATTYAVASGVSVFDAARLRNLQRACPNSIYLFRVIDELGALSRMSQGLSQVLTSVEKLSINTTQRLYLAIVPATTPGDHPKCIGILKVGVKKLFVRSAAGQLHELEPLCVLDFFVHESQQRHGVGRQLFDAMLVAERASPERLGYDRPSPKLLGFLRKHFVLSDFVPQTNNFVVFNQYFQAGASPPPPTAVGVQVGSHSSAAHLNRGGPSPGPVAAARPIILPVPPQVASSPPASGDGHPSPLSQPPPQPHPATHHRPAASAASNMGAAHGTSAQLPPGRLLPQPTNARVIPSSATAAGCGSHNISATVGAGPGPRRSADIVVPHPKSYAAAARERSPTRSGVDYDIITMQSSLGGMSLDGGGATAAPGNGLGRGPELSTTAAGRSLSLSSSRRPLRMM